MEAATNGGKLYFFLGLGGIKTQWNYHKPKSQERDYTDLCHNQSKF